MFGRMRLLHRVPHQDHRPDVPIIGHAASIGLLAPIAGALVGSLIGGFGFAMIGFALGLATAVLAVMITTAILSS
jgi:hypothetical protein